MYKLEKFQSRFGKVDEFGWWDLERMKTDAGTKFNLKQFKEVMSMHGIRLTLAAPDHHEMNGKFEVT